MNERWFIIPTADLTRQVKTDLEPNILGTFFPDTQRYSLDGSLVVVGHFSNIDLLEFLETYVEYTHSEIVDKMSGPAWSIPLF